MFSGLLLEASNLGKSGKILLEVAWRIKISLEINKELFISGSADKLYFSAAPGARNTGYAETKLP